MANGGNATQAAIEAGYSVKASRVQGHRLITRANIQAAIDALRDKDPQVMTRAQRQAWWTKVVNGEFEAAGARFADRTKASELLGRSQADFIEVRIAPIVTDPHASVDSLVDRFNAIVKTIEDRENAKENAMSPRAEDKPLRLAARNR